MKYQKIIIFAISILFLSTQSVKGETDSKFVNFFRGLEYEVNAGTNIGGASPLPLPAEIRKIESYNPELNLQVGASVRKWLSNDGKWGMGLGIRVETKGMKTKAMVKNYGMEIIDNGKALKGRWTGRVQTKYHSQQLVIPITAVYRLNDKIVFNAGPYLSFAFDNEFSGYVSDGYLREGDPTGDKITFSGDSKATYDFGSDLRKFQWGGQVGMSWLAYKRLLINANLHWGFISIFESSFKTISFSMYPIYLNVGFGYLF